MHTPSNRGCYIALEGLEGCGKSTQAMALATHYGAIVTREPGGTPVGSAVRDILLHTAVDISPRCEALLFAADRAEHIATVVEPALTAGRHVISDRSLWSSVVYQGYAHGLDVDELITLNEWATTFTPDLVVWLDTGATTHRERHVAGDRIEANDDMFFERARAGFQTLADTRDNWIVVDGSVDADTVTAAIIAAVDQRLTPQVTV